MENIKKMFTGNIVVANIGLKGFHSSIKEQGAQCIHIDWRPPAVVDKRILDILAKLNR
jgi:hypothetical protein